MSFWSSFIIVDVHDIEMRSDADVYSIVAGGESVGGRVAVTMFDCFLSPKSSDFPPVVVDIGVVHPVSGSR